MESDKSLGVLKLGHIDLDEVVNISKCKSTSKKDWTGQYGEQSSLRLARARMLR